MLQLAFLSDSQNLQRNQSTPSATEPDNKQQRGDIQTAQITEICLEERLAALHARRGQRHSLQQPFHTVTESGRVTRQNHDHK